MSRINPQPAMKLGIWAVLAITLWRVVMLYFDRTELYLDESQYWFWGQNLDFGYYSKPPMIAWVIRAVTELAGSSSPFWVRFPAPLFHGATALVLMAAARRLFGADARPQDAAIAGWIGPVYVLLPMATLGSALFSTDTVMLFFYALAFLAWVTLQKRASLGWAALMGVAIGCGMLSKYAMIYFVLGAGLAAIFVPAARILRRDSALAVIVALVLIAPNIWWNLQTGGTTFQHTLSNADWSARGPALHPGAMGVYFLNQFAVFGPVMFAAYLLLIARPRWAGHPPQTAILLWLSVPVLALMLAQALASHANANWGVAAYMGASLLVTRWLWLKARWALYASQALHLALALALPIVLLYPADLRSPDGHQYLHRYLGRAKISLTLAQLARAQGLDAIVTQNRELDADLHYTLRKSALRLYSLPHPGFPASYYEQEFAVPRNRQLPVLFVSVGWAPDCAAGRVKQWTPRDGIFADQTLIASRVGPDCLRRLRAGAGRQRVP